MPRVAFDLNLLMTAVPVCVGEKPMHCLHRHPFTGSDKTKSL